MKGQKLTLICKSESDILYSIDSPAELTVEMASSIQDSNRVVRVEWPRQPAPNLYLKELTPILDIHLIMECPLLVISAPNRFPVTTKDDATALNLVSLSFEEDYAKVWRDSVSRELNNVIRNTFVRIVRGCNTKIVELDDGVAGIIVTVDAKSYRGKIEPHLGWIWIKSDLPKDVRRSIAADLLSSAFPLPTTPILASVFVLNLKSLGCLRRAGFESIAVRIALREDCQ